MTSLLGKLLSLEPTREEIARRLDVPLDQIVVSVDTRPGKPLMTIEIHRAAPSHWNEPELYPDAVKPAKTKKIEGENA